MGKKVKQQSDEVTLNNDMRCWELRVKGYTQRKIAAELGFTHQGVSKMLKRVTRNFSKIFFDKVKDIKDEQALILEEVAQEIMQAWHKSAKGEADVKILLAFMKAKEKILEIYGANLPEPPDEDDTEVTEIILVRAKAGDDAN